MWHESPACVTTSYQWTWSKLSSNRLSISSMRSTNILLSLCQLKFHFDDSKPEDISCKIIFWRVQFMMILDKYVQRRQKLSFSVCHRSYFHTIFPNLIQFEMGKNWIFQVGSSRQHRAPLSNRDENFFPGHNSFFFQWRTAVVEQIPFFDFHSACLSMSLLISWWW